MVPARVALPILLAGLALAAAGAAPAASSTAAASSRAIAVRIVVPNAPGVTAGAVAAPPSASASSGGIAWRDALTTGSFASSSHAVGGDRGEASASVALGQVSLFGGEITADAIDTRASASATPSRASGTLAASRIGAVVVLGSAVRAAPNRRVALADWGYLVLLEQAVVRRASGRVGFRGFVTGLHVRLTKEHAGLPAETDIMVGYADAAASAPKASPPSNPPATVTVPGALSEPPKEPVPGLPGSTPTPPPVVQAPPADIRPQLTEGGYVFPVYGPSSFSDDFGAPRADVAWHHGNDIFAPLGAPVLAVADGTLFLVGWNDLGGNRLWLRDRHGNEFYFAHLSAYSPLAFDGSQVRAGDVIAFVGNTGDAAGTPTHLHFEIHPAQLLGLGYDGVVDPYAFLLGWQKLADVSFGSATWPPGQAPAPGAVLLEADDISTTSGTDVAGLTRALVMPPLFAEGKTFLEPPASPPRVTNAPVGFGAP
jgi:Peptidase family M23